MPEALRLSRPTQESEPFIVHGLVCGECAGSEAPGIARAIGTLWASAQSVTSEDGRGCRHEAIAPAPSGRRRGSTERSD